MNGLSVSSSTSFPASSGRRRRPPPSRLPPNPYPPSSPFLSAVSAVKTVEKTLEPQTKTDLATGIDTSPRKVADEHRKTTRPPTNVPPPRPKPSSLRPRTPPSMMATVCNDLEELIHNFIDPPVLRPSVDPRHVLSNNFAPVDELPPMPCPVVRGAIPRCLAGGAYIRNGPNPQHLPRGPHHLFDGDGMLHSLLLPASGDGTDPAILCSRYVRTYKYLLEHNAGAPVFPSVFSGFHGFAGLARGAVTAARVLTGQFNPTEGAGLANTSLVFFGDRLYALGESDLPYAVRVSPEDGEIVTLGRCDFDGRLFMGMTAHPKKDPSTGELFAFRYGPIPPFLTYFRFDAEGNKAGPDVPIFSVKQPSFLHDFAVTERYAIFPDLQIVMKPMDMVLGGGAPVGSDNGKVPRIGVLPRYASSEAEMRWFEVPGFNPVHAVNAWEEDASSAASRASVIADHLLGPYRSLANSSSSPVMLSPCLNYSPPDLSEKPPAFDVAALRRILDGHHHEARDWLFHMMEESPLFCPRRRGEITFVAPDHNQSKEQQRAATMRRIEYMLGQGVFEGWITGSDPEAAMRKFALFECIAVFDHSLSVKLGVHYFLWGGAIKFFGTTRHHDKWLNASENFQVKGCFAMTELGHGSNVRGIETIATYDINSDEFVINTPCESAQKYWIGGAANHATHTIIFSQLLINGTNQGVHAFIAQIRDSEGNICPNVRIADCGHKIGLNGVDNGRIWFDNIRIPRENLLNSVADVLPDGQYFSSIKNPDQRFAAFLAPLTSGRVNIAATAVYISKVGLAIAVRYALTRRVFSLTADGPEVLLLDYPAHQRRLLPLVAKICAMSSAANFLKGLYVNRTPESNKIVHIYSSALKATLTWNNIRILQECREACGGQGLKTENRIGILKAEFDVQSTFEGDNNVLMQQVSKALLAEYIAANKRKHPFRGLGLEHMNDPCPVIEANPTSSTLRSTEFQLKIFCLRERDLLARYASEVSQYQAHGESKVNAILLSHQLADELARAFSERTILQIFIKEETSQSPGPLKDVLGLLRSMYALTCVEEDASFLHYGYLSRDGAAAARREVSKLCGDLRPHALSLVNSFGIPDAFLSPIAFDWIEANSWSTVKDE